MSMRERLAGLALLGIGASIAVGQESPSLGEPADEAAVAAVSFTIMPDGDGLPAGSGNATAGAALFRRHCVACHGEGGAGGINDVLVGGQGSLATGQPVKTIGSYWPYATTLFDYIRRAMPYQSPGILSDDDVYSLTAYLLFVNDVIAEDLEIDAKSLPAVEMPNRRGFDWAYPARD